MFWTCTKTVKVLWNFTYIGLPEFVQLKEKARGLAVSLVEVQKTESYAIAKGPTDLLQRNLSLRSMMKVFGNAGFFTTLTVLVPTFRKEQVRIDNTLEPSINQAQMDGHNPVICLAEASKILALNPRCLVALVTRGIPPT